MATKSTYKTKQHDELLQYLASRQGQHTTAGEICDHFRTCGSPMGTATVYRQLEKMVSAGLVTKYIIDAGSPACFEYAGEHQEEVCWHCKCELCGRLIHMQCHELPGLEQHILAHHGFAIDAARTVFYGVCGECQAGKGTA